MLEISKQEETKFVNQYEPLVNKLTSQFYKKIVGCTSSCTCSWDDIKSMAYEGLALAIKQYDSKRSTMTFTQFAAYAIRNNILNGLNDELRTVKLSAYAQKKVVESGGTLFNTVSIDQPYNGDDNTTPREIVMGMYENEKFSNGDVLQYLYDRLSLRFQNIDLDIFYKTFGLHGEEEITGKTIAKMYGISEGRVSQRLKTVMDYIRHDKELCEMLATLREGVR